MIILVTGGASCGKSEIAENISLKLGGRKCYIATMKSYGIEGKLRIERHTKLRSGKGFDTFEKYTDLAGLDCAGYDTALLECVSNLLANEFFHTECVGSADGDNNAFSRIARGIGHLRNIIGNLVIVTNDIFCDGTVYDKSTMGYMECLGKVNRFLAAEADVIIESVCGIPVFLKGAIET